MTSWLASTLVSATLLMLLVLAVRCPIAKAFGARVAYALWLLPALRMALPPLPGHRALYVPVLQIDPAGPIQVGLVPPELPGDPVMLPPDLVRALDPVPHFGGWSWGTLLLAVWLVGAVLWFGWQMLRYHRFVAQALEGATPLGTECNVEVLLSDHVDGPVASGVLRRRIFLPRDFTRRYTGAERHQALLHEGAHHDRHDLLANLVGLVVLALHWWNPIAHIAHRAFRSDQELACDATVLARADAEARYAYGSALVKSACARTPAAACALDPATEIKRRLRMIKRARRSLPFRAAGALLATAAIGGGLFATASNGAPSSLAVEPPVTTVASPRSPAPADPLPPEQTQRLHARDPHRAELRAADEARLAGEQARLAADQARRAGERARIAADDARRAALADGDVARVRRISIDQTRASMVAACAARGRPVRPDERDWSELALCGKAAFHADIQAAIAEAHDAWRTVPTPPDTPDLPAR